jgi:ubiquinone/menaquinone biosynthesis C-methylase UbiE
MTEHFWDERYGKTSYAYGKAPNRYFKKFIDEQPPGKLLLPGEGEGRNAVYAARKGWQVVAIDQSAEGMKKAGILAKENNVSIDYRLADLATFPFQEGEFDAIALIFLHLPPDIRRVIHTKFIQSLVPGGYLMVEAFARDQLGRPSGGPPVRDLLYDELLLTLDFESLTMIERYETEEWLNEGQYHQGPAHIVRLLARKKHHLP